MTEKKTSLHVAVNSVAARQGAKEVTDAVGKMKKGAGDASKGVDQLDKKLDHVGKTSKTVKGLLGKAFAGVGAFMVLRSATRTIADFESTMSTLRAVTKAESDVMAEMEKSARGLGATTKYSATEAGEGLVFLARAGFDAYQSMAALPSTLDLAAAGALELGNAADIASNVLSQFNMHAEETARVSDTLVTTANNANTNVQQLAEALKMAGPVAGALGYTVESTAASLGVLGDAGIQASLAGTNLRGVLSGLLGPTSAAERALHDLGLTAAQVNPETHELADIFELLHRRGLSAAQAVEIFGRRNAAAALIFSRSTQRMRELTEMNELLEGAAKDAAKVMADNLAGSAKALRSAFEEAILATGDAGFAGALRSVTDTATGTVRILAGVEAETDKLTFASKALAEALKVGLVYMSGMMALKFAKWIGGLRLALLEAAAATTTATVTTSALDAALVGTTASATAAKGALVGLFAVIRAHPIAAIVTVVTSAAVAWKVFGDHVSESEKRLRKFNLTASDVTSIADAFKVAKREFEAAFAVSSLEGQVESVEKLANSLDSAYDKILRDMTENGKRAVSMETLEVFSGGVSFFDVGELKKSYVESFRESILAATSSAELKDVATEAANVFNANFSDAYYDAIPKKMVKDASGGFFFEPDIEAGPRLEEYRQNLLGVVNTTNLIGIASADAMGVVKAMLDNTKEYLTDVVGLRKEEVAAIAEATEAEIANAIAAGDSKTTIEDVVQAYEDQAKAIGKSEEQLGRMEAAAKALAASQGLPLEEALANVDQVLAAYDEMIKKQGQYNDAINSKASSSSYNQLISDLELELELLGQTEAKQRELIFLKGVEGELTDEEIKKLKEKLADLEQGKVWEGLARGAGTALGGAFEDIIFDAENATEHIANLFQQLSHEIVNALLIKPFINQLTAWATPFLPNLFGQAHGNAFLHGQVVPFGDGGIFTGPTLFPMADERTGLAGEAGYEVFMPAKRLSGGDVGVKVDLGQAGGDTYHTTLNIYGVSNVDEFRKNSRQVASEFDRALRNR